MFFLLFDYFYTGIRQFLATNFNFLRGTPIWAPQNLKISKFSKVTQHDNDRLSFL